MENSHKSINPLPPTQSTPKKQFTISDNPSTDQRNYALSDQVSVTAITDITGTVQERYGYTAFGAPLFMTPTFLPIPSSQFNWETLYDSYRYDCESGFYQVRNRYLHSMLGRWLTRDPIGYEDGVNLYAYVHNGPTSNIDPLGTQGIAIPFEALALLIALAIALGITLCALLARVIALVGRGGVSSIRRANPCFWNGDYYIDWNYNPSIWYCIYLCLDGTTVRIPTYGPYYPCPDIAEYH